MRGLLRTAEEKRQAALAELSAKHQKVCVVCIFYHLCLAVFLVSRFGGFCNLSSLIRVLILLIRK